MAVSRHVISAVGRFLFRKLKNEIAFLKTKTLRVKINLSEGKPLAFGFGRGEQINGREAYEPACYGLQSVARVISTVRRFVFAWLLGRRNFLSQKQSARCFN